MQMNSNAPQSIKVNYQELDNKTACIKQCADTFYRIGEFTYEATKGFNVTFSEPSNEFYGVYIFIPNSFCQDVVSSHQLFYVGKSTAQKGIRSRINRYLTHLRKPEVKRGNERSVHQGLRIWMEKKGNDNIQIYFLSCNEQKARLVESQLICPLFNKTP